MSKKLVHYQPDKEDIIELNQSAIIMQPLDHPNCSNWFPCITSPVHAIFDGGIFETQNSRFVPVKTDQENTGAASEQSCTECQQDKDFAAALGLNGIDFAYLKNGRGIAG